MADRTICITESETVAFCREPCWVASPLCPLGLTCVGLVGDDQLGICAP